jgi:hypothetical protein
MNGPGFTRTRATEPARAVEPESARVAMVHVPGGRLSVRALAGTLTGFTGIDDPYEPPDSCELVVSTDGPTEEESAAAVLRHLG